MKDFQRKLMLHFSCMWAITAIGMAVGMTIPIELLTPTLTASLIIYSVFMRKSLHLIGPLICSILTTIIIGTMAGVVLPIAIPSIGILSVALFVMSLTILTPLLYAVPLLLGMTLSWSTHFEIGALDDYTALGLIIAAICIFILIGLSGGFLPDVSGWGVYLFGVLVVTAAIGLLSVFLPGSNLVLLFIAWAILIAFVFFTFFSFTFVARIEGSET